MPTKRQRSMNGIDIGSVGRVLRTLGEMLHLNQYEQNWITYRSNWSRRNTPNGRPCSCNSQNQVLGDHLSFEPKYERVRPFL